MSKKTKQTKNVQVTPKDHNVIHRVEVGVAAVLVLIVIILHFVVLFHSGGLWRDEANSVNLITMTSMLDFGPKFQSESFPILWLSLLRAWTFIGFGGSDLALRLLGLITGLGALGALWYTARILGTGVPIIALVLFAMAPVTFIGDSLRAYGLGLSLILLSLAAMWNVLKNPSLWRMVVCAVIVVLSTQCLYHNAFLVFSICMGAAVVGLYRRDWRSTVFPLGAGVLAAASYVPYLGIISEVMDRNIITKIPVDLMWFLYKIKKAVDPSGFLLTWVWAVLLLLTVIVFVWLVVKSTQSWSVKEKELALFLLTTMMISIVAYFVFIKILSRPTQNWYYLSLIGVLIVIIDRAVAFICKIYSHARIIRIVCVLAITLFVFMDSWNAAHTRKTNVDVIAAKLETLAGKDDLIVVTRFFYGVTFLRYYKGSAPWVTLPEIADHSVHRYDLLKEKMMEKEPIKPVLQKITQTLQNGHRVWIVGKVLSFPPGVIPRELPPAPNSPYGWRAVAYELSWIQMAVHTLQTYGQTLTMITIRVDDPVFEEENLPLMVVQNK